jgi:hypothetical protein
MDYTDSDSDSEYYMTENITCKCGSNIKRIGLSTHLKSQKHMKYENKENLEYWVYNCKTANLNSFDDYEKMWEKLPYDKNELFGDLIDEAFTKGCFYVKNYNELDFQNL